MILKHIRWIFAMIGISLIVVACNQVPLVTPTITETGLDQVDTTATPEHSIPTFAFIGLDRNLWVLDKGSENPRQLTYDASPIGSGSTMIEYGNPHLSTDGTLLAYSQDIGTPSAGGYDIVSGLWVMNLMNGELRQILDGRHAGLAWKPDSHILVFGSAVDENYFFDRGNPDSSLANGLNWVDMDSGEILQLVPPQRGYTLSTPMWSLDGRFLGFSEIFGMEGSGLFAYFNLETQEYIAWEEAVGQISWSPDGEFLSYARHTYVASGDERLYLRPRQGNEQLLGPDYEGPAYATHPVFSPDGDHIAYLAFMGGPETQIATIMVLDLVSSETRSLGQFDGVWELAWVPDGSHIVFSFGSWESPQIAAINVMDNNQIVLTAGSQPTLAGQ